MPESLNTMVNLFADNSPEDIAFVIKQLTNKLEGSNIAILPSGICSFQSININNVRYLIQTKKLSGEVHFETGEVLNINGYDLLAYMETHFEHFKILDQPRGLIVNMNFIHSYDSYMNRIYFIDEEDLRITDAAMRNIVQKRLGKEYERNANQEDLTKDLYASTKSKKFKMWGFE